MKPHRATLILVFGILGLVCCPPFGVASWIMGRADLSQMDAGIMDASGRSITNAGRICGIIGTILGIVGVLLTVLAVALIMAGIITG